MQALSWLYIKLGVNGSFVFFFFLFPMQISGDSWSTSKFCFQNLVAEYLTALEKRQTKHVLYFTNTRTERQ